MSLFSSLTRGITPRIGYPEQNNISREHIYNDLQQQYRFILSLQGIDAAYVKDVERPSYTINTNSYKLLNWEFNYPTTLKWANVSFTLVEIFSLDAVNSVAGLYMDKLLKTAYEQPSDLMGPIHQNTFIKDLSKRDLTQSLGPVKIRAINPDGDTVEEWELRNAMVVAMAPSQYSYDGELLTTMRITLQYDWATYDYKGAAPPPTIPAR
tara:strand:- start:2976 stop:3602 length:627 start_codon:yes stop_codon:yes gene_type:complete